MKKVLFVATVDSHIRHFHIPYLKYFKEQGYEVHVATCNDENEQFPYCDKKHTITFEREPFKLNNLKAINQMKTLLKEEQFDIIHCHTPMGSVVTRIAAKKARKNGTKVMYTAHGFHFYDGAPLKNWLVFYPVERWLSRYTDVLITINKEDYERCKKFKAKKYYLIDGIGVDDTKFNFTMTEAEKEALRNELSNDIDANSNVGASIARHDDTGTNSNVGASIARPLAQSNDAKFKLNADDIVLTYVAEMIPRKNQTLLIDAMQEIVKQNPKVKLLLVGTGILTETYKNQIDTLGLNANVKLTGYRKDVPKIFKITDISVSSSKQEGLAINVIEALMSGVPVVVSNVRGNKDLVVENKNGFTFESNNKEDLISTLTKVINEKMLREKLKKNTLKSVKKFRLENTLKEMKEIYEAK